MQKIIEFADKVALNENADIPETNKITDDNINEIKAVVNGSLQGTNAMGSIVVDDVNCKNMFGVNSTTTRSGVTSIYNGSTLTLNGTSIGEDFNEDYALKMVRLSAGTYTFTIQAISGTKTGSQSLVIRNIDDNSSILDTNFTGNYTYTFTLNQDTNINVLIYYLASGNVFTNYVTNIQIEKGSEATPYTPYKNFENEEIYSEGEIKIGTWIDGKPLYRKSVVIDPLVYSTANQEYAIMTISNLKDVIEFKGTLWNSARTYQYGLGYYNNNNYSKLLYKNDGKIYFQSSDTWSNSKVIATVTYTKTTD